MNKLKDDHQNRIFDKLHEKYKTYQINKKTWIVVNWKHCHILSS